MANHSIESLKGRCKFLGEQVVEQQQIITELQPKANYVDMILQSKSLVTITHIAKDYGMSGRKLNKILKELKIQYKVGGQWVLYSKYQNGGYVHSRTIDIKTTNILQSMQYEKWKDRIPDNYYIQVLHYLLVTGWQFVVLRAHLNTDWGNEKRTTVKHYFIERRDVEADLIMLQQEEEKFWRYVESGRKPPLILPEI